MDDGFEQATGYIPFGVKVVPEEKEQENSQWDMECTECEKFFSCNGKEILGQSCVSFIKRRDKKCNTKGKCLKKK